MPSLIRTRKQSLPDYMGTYEMMVDVNFLHCLLAMINAAYKCCILHKNFAAF